MAKSPISLSASPKRVLTSPSSNDTPRGRPIPSLFKDYELDVEEVLRRLAVPSQVAGEDDVAIQGLLTWIFLSTKTQTIRQAMLLRAAKLLAARLHEKKKDAPVSQLVRAKTLLDDSKYFWVLNDAFLGLGGIGALARCKSSRSIPRDIGREMKGFKKVLPLVMILHLCADRLAGDLPGRTGRLSFHMAQTVYLSSGFHLSSNGTAPTTAAVVDTIGTPGSAAKTKDKDRKLKERMLKRRWAKVRLRVGFLYAATGTFVKDGKSLHDEMSSAEFGVKISRNTLLSLCGRARFVHETVLAKMVQPADWNITFPDAIPSIPIPLPTLVTSQEALILSLLRGTEAPENT